MSLTIEAKAILILDEDEVLDLIKKVYGFEDYSISEREDITYPYGAYYPFSVDETDIDCEWDEITEYASLQAIFVDLAKKGHINLGTYYIWIEY